MDYEPNKLELVELEFKHAVAEASDYYANKTDEEDPDSELYYAGDAMCVMADLMVQRFQYAEFMIYDDHSDSVSCAGKKETKELFSKRAHNYVTVHVSIGMLNHNTELLERMIKAYPDQFNIVWSLYVTTFMTILQPDSVYLKKEFFKYKIDIEWTVQSLSDH